MIDLMPGFGAFTPVSAGSASTWNPADKSADVALSGGNLIASYAAGSAYRNVRSTDGKSTGKFYSEHICVYTTADRLSVGVANSSATLTDYGGIDTGSVVIYMNGDVYYNNGLLGNYALGISSGGRVDMAANLTDDLIWWRGNGGNWNNSGTADPATNTGGITISPTGTLFVLASLREAADSNTARFLSSSWAGSPPSGYGQWGP